MKKAIIFAAGVLVGSYIGIMLGKKGVGSNSGTEFWGDTYAALLKGTGKGIGNNSGSKFYSDTYIKEKFKVDNA